MSYFVRTLLDRRRCGFAAAQSVVERVSDVTASATLERVDGVIYVGVGVEICRLFVGPEFGQRRANVFVEVLDGFANAALWHTLAANIEECIVVDHTFCTASGMIKRLIEHRTQR